MNVSRVLQSNTHAFRSLRGKRTNPRSPSDDVTEHLRKSILKMDHASLKPKGNDIGRLLLFNGCTVCTHLSKFTWGYWKVNTIPERRFSSIIFGGCLRNSQTRLARISWKARTSSSSVRWQLTFVNLPISTVITESIFQFLVSVNRSRTIFLTLLSHPLAQPWTWHLFLYHIHFKQYSFIIYIFFYLKVLLSSTAVARAASFVLRRTW